MKSQRIMQEIKYVKTCKNCNIELQEVMDIRDIQEWNRIEYNR